MVAVGTDVASARFSRAPQCGQGRPLCVWGGVAGSALLAAVAASAGAWSPPHDARGFVSQARASARLPPFGSSAGRRSGGRASGRGGSLLEKLSQTRRFRHRQLGRDLRLLTRAPLCDPSTPVWALCVTWASPRHGGGRGDFPTAWGLPHSMGTSGWSDFLHGAQGFGSECPSKRGRSRPTHIYVPALDSHTVTSAFSRFQPSHRSAQISQVPGEVSS